MPRAFAAITFTESVKAAQTRYHSREGNLGFELAEDARSEITEREAEFIAERDSFYMATVGDNGWPYVQHRGGPQGFLKVLDEHTIAFADFRGNTQYLSVGNLNGNDRVALILVDYPQRRRVKIWGRARIVHEAENPELIAALESPAYRARIERAIVITVEAWDWNCPQHITPRYTDADIESLIAPLQAELAELKAQQAGVVPALPSTLGNGPLPLVITGIRQLTPSIRAFELRAVDGGELPPVRAGAHLKVPVMLKDGSATVRHYSIASNPARRDIYEIAVQLEAQGAGGSQFAHHHYRLGLQLNCSLPGQDFELQTSAAPVVLIAGGVGITAIKPMAQTLKAAGRDFQLHYAARSRRDMAYGDRLQRDLGAQMLAYFSGSGPRLNIAAVLQNAAPNTEFYVCGPSRLLDALMVEAKVLGIASERIHFERFSAPAATGNTGFKVHLQRTRREINVAPDQTVLQALEGAGVQTLSDCGVGNCGTCAVKVLAGEVEHRDNALTANERSQAGLMCVCVSRAKSEFLTLDL